MYQGCQTCLASWARSEPKGFLVADLDPALVVGQAVAVLTLWVPKLLCQFRESPGLTLLSLAP